MGKFYAPKKLLIEDFPDDARSWLGKLIDPLNQFMTQVATALTQGLVIFDNSKSVTFNVDIIANQTYPLTYNLASLKQRPTAVLIGQLTQSDESAPSNAYALHWKYNDGTLSYTLIGLDASKSYKATIVVLT